VQRRMATATSGGTTLQHLINGWYGDDVVRGFGGDDQLVGSYGNDLLRLLMYSSYVRGRVVEPF
jgi:hypothetical protein